MKEHHLPDIPDLTHAILDSFEILGSQTVAIRISPLIWHGTQGQFGKPITLSFWNFLNPDAVALKLQTEFVEGMDFGYVGYSKKMLSKPGRIFFEFASERDDRMLEIHCGRVTIEE